MRGVPLAAIAALVFALATETVRASVVFTFTEVGANVSMTSAGTLDTTNLVAGGRGGWGGVGIEQNGQSDVMGGTLFGQTDVVFGFHEGTDFSPWAGASGPWSVSNQEWSVVSGTNSFATYRRTDDSDTIIPGINMRAVDMVAGLWTPDQSWINLNSSFASLGMVLGIYTIADALTGESITIQIGPSIDPIATPLPAALPLFASALGLGGFLGYRRKRKAAMA